MVLELNNVVLEGCEHGLSMIARSGQLVCLTNGTAALRSRCLLAMLGLEPVTQGYVSIDGEPLLPETAFELRKLMAYAPASLDSIGQIRVYNPPTVQELFSLKANRQAPISNGILSEEVRRAGGAELVAVAALLDRQILLADTPPAVCADYLASQAENGRIVVVATTDAAFIDRAHVIVNCE